MKIKKIILDHLNMSEFEQDFIKPNRRISFNEKVHVFDMSKPAPSPKTPKRSKIITPILKQSPNTSSDEECDYLPPTYKQAQPICKQTQPIYKQSEPDCKQSRNTGTMQSKAFLYEVISELKNHQQKVRTIFFGGKDSLKGDSKEGFLLGDSFWGTPFGRFLW